MRLEHQFRVAAPIDEVWSALLDPLRVAPCMPGATLTSVEAESFAGTVKVKLGPVALLYKGTGSFESTDADARRAVIKASGKDSRGNGTASATVEVNLLADGGETVAAVVTDLSVTGRPAQFGRGMISEVGGKILDRFAECLAGKLAPATEAAPDLPVATGPAGPERSAEAPDPPVAKAPEPPPAAEPLDLFEVAAAPAARRAAVVIGAVVLLIVIVAWLRRR